MMNEETNDFDLLLESIQSKITDDFAGIGLVLYDDLEHLSHLQMNDYELPVKGWDQIENVLLEISTNDHPCHDGFHAISTEGTLTHVSLYLAPTIEDSEKDDSAYGSRFYTAKFAAKTPGIIKSAVISKDYGIRLWAPDNG